MLTERDLCLISYDYFLLKDIKLLQRTTIIELIETWLKIPELKPDNDTTISHYKPENKKLLKAELIERMTTVDWVMIYTLTDGHV
jgi:hypothetical protein